jgi:hypothetical protein
MGPYRKSRLTTALPQSKAARFHHRRLFPPDERRAPHPACPLLYPPDPPARREPLDAAFCSGRSWAHRATRGASDLGRCTGASTMRKRGRHSVGVSEQHGRGDQSRKHRVADVRGFVRMTSVNMMEGVNELTEGDDLLVPRPRRARNCVHIGNPGHED